MERSDNEDYLDKKNPDGTNFGLSDSKIGFYGLTAPVTKPAMAAAAVTGAQTSNVSWGFASAAHAASVVTLLNEIRAKMVALGLVAT